jgi:tetratricopeptide (TPR) repeat protein
VSSRKATIARRWRERRVSNAPLIVLLAISAIWPFGRDRDRERDREKEPEPTGTIKDLERSRVRVDTSAAIAGSETKAMESYRLFLDLESEDPLLRAEAMRRLADLQLETVDVDELASNVQSLGALGGTIQMYEQLLEAYPNYAKNDLVLYQLARAYEAEGRNDESLATLDRLLARYPNTVHRAEAEFRRGETLFVLKRYREAERAYEHVLAAGETSGFHQQALYKHGWSLFKQQQYDESLGSFFGLLDLQLGTDNAATGDRDPAVLYSAMGRAQQELIDDTFRVLSIGFSYLDGPESISRYFNRRGARPYGFIAYTNLGDLYLEQERFQDAADAYHAFVELDPYHAKAPLLQVEVIEAFKKGEFADLVLQGKESFVETYGPGSPYWQRFTFEQQPEVVAHLKSNVTDLAAYHHAEAQKTKAEAEYAAAARWYRAYLQSFPDDVNAGETNFLLGEVLFESGNYRDAAAEYERTAYAYPFHANGGEAGYAALLAYAKHEESLSGAVRADWHRQGIDSALRFAGVYPEHTQAPIVQTDAAEKLFKLGEFARARDVGRAVVTRNPAVETKLQRTAWTVVAHSEFDLGDFLAAEGAYQQLVAFVPGDDPERREITERIASSIYKQGEQARAAGQLDVAVDHFLRVAQAAPGSPVRATAEYDAGAALIQLGDWQRATTVLESFRASFPNHELAAEVTTKLAVAYVEAGNSARAASEFERIADGAGTDDIKREALWRSAELYESTGQSVAAAGAFARFVERYPNPVAEAVEARQKLIDFAGAAGNQVERVRWMKDLVAADAMAGSERTDRTRYLAAKSQLALAAPTRDAFLGTRLVIPLDKSLATKQARMEDALAAYGKAADYGVAEVTTAANYEIAELYHSLSKDLYASERPAELTAEELEQYDILLEEQAFPFEEEAIELHETNAARTAEGVYDEWVKKSLAALVELLPGRYAKAEIGETLVEAVSPRAAPAAAVAADDERGRRDRRRDRRAAAEDSAAAGTALIVPEAAAAGHARALVAMRAENWLEAELELEQLTLEHPEYPGPQVNLAIVYLHDGRRDDAREALTRALDVDADHAAANTQLAVLLREDGKFADAEAAYRRALATDPEHALAHYNLGVLLDVYLRQPAEALEHYELYQASLAEPNETVGRWIIDLRRRAGNAGAARVAQENAP